MYNRFVYSLILLFLIAEVKYAQNKPAEKWQTFFEKSDFLETPGYDESIQWFKKITDNSPYARMFTFGITPQGREMKYLVVTKGGEFTPAAARNSGKAIVLIEAGIHAGEIEGKDAGMILLREMLISKEKEALLNNIVLIFIPVLNVDGHERISPFNRINQNGPVNMGWRTTARNLNLNRDFMKADAPEMQSLLKLFSDWIPDFFIDSHTTDGADYQYTVTYGIEKFQNIDESISSWLKGVFIPFIKERIEAKGYLFAPYVGFKDDDPNKGLTDWAAQARLSTGYAALQNRPALLIETHMLKPYKDRVLATKETFEAALLYLNKKSQAVRTINKNADISAVKMFFKEGKYLPVTFRDTEKSTRFLFKGIEADEDSSWIAGKKIKRYNGRKKDFEIPYFNDIVPADSITVPAAYLIPRQWGDIIDRLRLHGIEVGELASDTTLEAGKIRFSNVKFAERPYEGHFQPAYDLTETKEKIRLKKGTYIVRTDQRTVRVIANLLDPKGPDSFIKWGFFNTIFEQKEYFEDYSMEPVAEKMIEKDPALKAEFEKRIRDDEAFRKNPYRRLNFFYERSDYYDKEFNIYPVLKLY